MHRDSLVHDRLVGQYAGGPADSASTPEERKQLLEHLIADAVQDASEKTMYEAEHWLGEQELLK